MQIWYHSIALESLYRMILRSLLYLSIQQSYSQKTDVHFWISFFGHNLIELKIFRLSLYHSIELLNSYRMISNYHIFTFHVVNLHLEKCKNFHQKWKRIAPPFCIPSIFWLSFPFSNGRPHIPVGPFWARHSHPLLTFCQLAGSKQAQGQEQMGGGRTSAARSLGCW